VLMLIDLTLCEFSIWTCVYSLKRNAARKSRQLQARRHVKVPRTNVQGLAMPRGCCALASLGSVNSLGEHHALGSQNNR
jgi:hypothetical protein